jgi:hypothetical protein
MQTQALPNWTPTTEATGSLTPWPLPTATLNRRRAAKALDELLDVDHYPDVDEFYPRISLREVA